MEEFEGKNGASVQKRILLIALLLAALLLVLLAFIRIRNAAPVAVASPAPAADFHYEHAMDVWFLDVGQGDAILIRSPGGKLMLVDAGSSDKFYAVYHKMEELGVDRLDAIVCTHAHEDHIGAMPKVIETYGVGSAYFPHGAKREDYEEVYAALDAKGVSPKTVTATMTSFIDFDPEIEVRVLSPFDTDYEDENEGSLVLRVSYGNTSVLLAADVGALAERLMLKALPNALFDSDILKLGHHGSYSSTSEKFLKAVSPGLAVASCSKGNEYGHPDEEIVSLLEKKGVLLLTTADYGTIHAVLDGSGIKVVEY